MKNGASNIKMMVTGGVLKNGETPDDIQLTFDEVRAGVIEAHHKGFTVAAHAQAMRELKRPSKLVLIPLNMALILMMKRLPWWRNTGPR